MYPIPVGTGDLLPNFMYQLNEAFNHIKHWNHYPARARVYTIQSSKLGKSLGYFEVKYSACSLNDDARPIN
jgi:hypothetical protein